MPRTPNPASWLSQAAAQERVILVVVSDSQYRSLLADIASATNVTSAPNPLARLAKAPRPSPLAVGDLEVMVDEPVAYVGQGARRARLTLPTTEHRLLSYLLGQAERVCNREQIVAGVWLGAPTHVRTVDQYIRRLRKSLASVSADAMLQTVNRVGYRLVPYLEVQGPMDALHPRAVTAVSQSLPTVTSSTGGEVRTRAKRVPD